MDEEVLYFFLILKAFSKVILPLFRATVRDTDIQYKG